MTDSELQSAITAIADNSPNTASEFRAILNELYLRTPKSKTIIIKDVTNQYIADNFDGTGLGINLEVGYAIVNGNNGTRDWNDRLPLAYGTSNATMGAMKGANTHTLLKAELPSYNLELPVQNISTGSSGNNVQGTGSAPGGGTALIPSGGSGTAFSIENKTIVTLVLMKL